ncbi:helix-turn-helix domain-containing protein [Streptomyces shenzhenensis]|uniref:helix-turn-helix domain-containing protein n=1 Tax=Streptomyces shenzhenensis TaxID=943815 RepID=UPI0033D8EA0A
MSDDFDAVLAAVGPRLRELRRRRGVTLTALSETTGIPISTLSRLESGHRKPGLELLLPLARAYQVPVDELIGAPADLDPRVYPQPFTRNGMTVVPLTRKPGGLQAFKHILPAGLTDGREPDPRSHEGYHWLYVLRGRLRVVLGDKDFILTEGEVAGRPAVPLALLGRVAAGELGAEPRGAAGRRRRGHAGHRCAGLRDTP